MRITTRGSSCGSTVSPQIPQEAALGTDDEAPDHRPSVLDPAAADADLVLVRWLEKSAPETCERATTVYALAPNLFMLASGRSHSYDLSSLSDATCDWVLARHALLSPTQRRVFVAGHALPKCSAQARAAHLDALLRRFFNEDEPEARFEIGRWPILATLTAPEVCFHESCPAFHVWVIVREWTNARDSIKLTASTSQMIALEAYIPAERRCTLDWARRRLEMLAPNPDVDLALDEVCRMCESRL